MDRVLPEAGRICAQRLDTVNGKTVPGEVGCQFTNEFDGTKVVPGACYILRIYDGGRENQVVKRVRCPSAVSN